MPGFVCLSVLATFLKYLDGLDNIFRKCQQVGRGTSCWTLGNDLDHSLWVGTEVPWKSPRAFFSYQRFLAKNVNVI